MPPLSGTRSAAAAVLRPGRVGRIGTFVVWVAAERSAVVPAGKQAAIAVQGSAAAPALRRVWVEPFVVWVVAERSAAAVHALPAEMFAAVARAGIAGPVVVFELPALAAGRGVEARLPVWVAAASFEGIVQEALRRIAGPGEPVAVPASARFSLPYPCAWIVPLRQR